MLETIVLVASLANPGIQSGNPSDRANAYYSEGMRLLRVERYDKALKKFEMAVMLARFAFGDRQLEGASVKMAASTAIAAGNAEKAVSNAKEYIDWSTRQSSLRDIARARNDLLEAYLLLENLNAAGDAVELTRDAVTASRDREQMHRFQALEERVRRGRAGASGRPAVRRQTLGARSPIIRRRIQSADAPTSATTPPLNPAARASDARSETTTAGATAATNQPPNAASPHPKQDGVTRLKIRRVGGRQTAPAPQPTPVSPIEPASKPTARPLPAASQPARLPAASPPARLAPERQPLRRASKPTAAPNGAGSMVTIPAGEFEMGDTGGERDEMPLRKIRLHAFQIDRHEVTNGEFQRFVETAGYQAAGDWNSHAGSGLEQMPVRGVTHADASAYAEWAGKRLPTETEWERAARGPEGLPYAFGAGYARTAARLGLDQAAGPAPVGSYRENSWGVHDMTGNVSEWCADWYDALVYRRTFSWFPDGPRRGSMRVVRGGSWRASENTVRTAKRAAADPAAGSPETGFRCAKDVP